MKAYKKLQNILAIAAILLSSFAFGQAQTEYINYQGVARDASNEILANQSIQIGISLRFGLPTATVLYSENHTITSDISGVFSLQIGTGDVTAGIYKDLEWGKLAPYASISLNGSDVGTVALQSVPYANSSGKAVNMQLNDLTDIEGTPINNQVLKWNGTSWIPGDISGSSSIWKKGTGNNIFYNSGNVGIGTIQPMHPLEISSSTSESIKIQSTSPNNWIGFHNNEGFQGYMGINWDDKDIVLGTALFNTTGKVHLATNSIPKLTVARNGNVGIGTVSPEVKLDVRGGDGNLISYEGDFRIGNSTHRLKMGVFTDGPDLGRASIRAVGGKNELYLGAGPGLETLRIKEDAVEITKKLKRPSTGNADLIPVAYGTISADGTIKSGTGNFRVERPGPIGYTLVIIDFVNFSSAHTSIVTLQGSVERAFISAGSEFVAGGYALAVKTSVLNDNGQPNGRSFQNFSFVVYKQ
ncbi:hypothetical protein [Gelidibacter gilvus]|uniref:DUF4402 domain-containing protein n=1 Tax=Gelidibacter gilvus TaxID=59602 RepID=A0A4Q0XEP0_9FLAO|nr:hypothetical protein [Gelidibacter gilvus]RXJ44452.1 hypothetical protein ESZ48_17455 [Gelidibacter gilvus]